MNRNYPIEEIHTYGVDIENRIIYASSEIDIEGEENGVDYKMASKFLKNVDFLNRLSSKVITVKMMNCGGDWNYGMAMYDCIKKSKAQINTISYAHARSMSSIIPQASKIRHISNHADFMVHYGEYGDSGDMRKVISGIKHYEIQNKVMLDIYAERCVNGEFFGSKNYSMEDAANYIREQIDKKTDWWMTAQESVYYGFMDKVV
jgi:ATP-dependent protease ClpP protease subunit